MNITVNGESKEIFEEVNLSDLLKMLALPSGRVAVEMNKEVVRKKDWESVRVGDGDKLEIIHFVGGG